MSIISIDRNPSRRTLNQFGLLWMGFFALFGALGWFKFHNHTAAWILWAAAVAVPVLGWLAPPFLRLVFLGLSYATWPIGFVISHLVLAAVYYLILTPLGLTMRLLGYDPMRRSFDRETRSYWIERPKQEAEPKRYFRQF